MIQDVLVLGGGSAGFIAAITLKARIPALRVRVLRSKEIGVIGVGEATTVGVPLHLHEYLKVDLPEFFRVVQPVWKLAIRFLWGTRPYFDYTFAHQLHMRYLAVPKYVGFYCADEYGDHGMQTALMSRGKAFPIAKNGLPYVGKQFGYHLENESFVQYLEMLALRLGVVIEETTVVDVAQNEQGISSLRADDGRTYTADLYLDSSGFRSVLLGKALAEPYISFSPSLYCDRAVTGAWPRAAAEAIQPYTVAETMDHGWCWQIDHPHAIHRGYVYSSAFVSDADAEKEFRLKNPRVTEVRQVRYRSGRYARAWVKNVVAIGNSGGFVEPLESTGLAAICSSMQNLAEMLADCDLQPPSTLIRLFNDRAAAGWDSIRRFLATHYKFNRRLDTPFWRECREKADLAGAEHIVEFYRENGPTPIGFPTLVDRADQFGAEGWLSMLLGMQVPFTPRHVICDGEWRKWREIQAHIAHIASAGISAEDMLERLHSQGFEGVEYFK